MTDTLTADFPDISDYPERLEARHDGPIPKGFFEHIESHVVEFGVPVKRTSDGLRVAFAQSDVQLACGDDWLTVSIAAKSHIHLYQMRESVLYLLDHVLPDAANELFAGPDNQTPDVPPNFHHATVASVDRISANFLRVELDCDGVGALLHGGMHFTLLMPPRHRRPVWPVINEKGRTVWAEGEDALHRAAYTFVDLDAHNGRFTFDVFEHDGGRTTEWARQAQPGDKVAVMGPGGGDFPPGNRLLMAGDETALPAIRRILEHSGPDRRGSVLLEIGDAADRCELTVPEGIDVRWIMRGQGGSLWDALLEQTVPEDRDDYFVWVAAEQEFVRKAKAHFRSEYALPRTQGYFSAYWAV
ncbi:siderophore-interacting protein [Pseudoruegeria sp. HB172150]|uniref:siderophore-interacting protein n=1 Tax=Pseudoruegeria sp. HB172150 TaxID=2721164 RepID=UPI001557B82E|nr:siderophore-interacting protein [Pseudoruegeria sp. HB172150]